MRRVGELHLFDGIVTVLNGPRAEKDICGGFTDR